MVAVTGHAELLAFEPRCKEFLDEFGCHNSILRPSPQGSV
jgi:hypothetical protein